IAVAGPALLISVVNLVFFILTVVAIKRVYSLQASASINRDHHTNLYVYAKLSTMTGTFWTLSIIAENLDVDFLRLIPIFINGLQGVFLFISYICNKRVLRLYLPRMSGHSDVITKVSVK
ncbi:G-protein coupled receptor mth, partial [Biomphalaria glabrata]